MRALSFLGTVLAAALSLSTSSCASMFYGMHDTEMTFPLKPLGSGTFSAWNEITLDQDINSVATATLVSVQLSIEGAPDFTFLRSLRGYAQKADGSKVLLITLENPPAGVQPILPTLNYFDDLHPLFKDNHTIHITWNGETNPAYTSWPADGFQVTVKITIDVEG
jgi:hypothetical protein